MARDWTACGRVVLRDSTDTERIMLADSLPPDSVGGDICWLWPGKISRTTSGAVRTSEDKTVSPLVHPVLSRPAATTPAQR